MNVDSTQTTLEQIRNAHQEAARLAAGTFFIPKEFLSDPTFLNLVKMLRSQEVKVS